MRCSHRAAHPLRRETLSALRADSAPERRTGRALPGARGAARARPRVALVCGPRGPPRRNTRRGCPHPPRCAGLLRGSLRPSLPRLWRGPPPLFAHCAPAPLRGARRGARRLWPGAWRGPPAPPGARGPPAGWPPGPVCVPSGSLFGRPPPLRPSRWFSRFAAPGAPPFGGPPVPRGASPRAPVPRLRSTRRGRARAAARAYGARCAPAGVTVGFCSACAFAPAVVPVGGLSRMAARRGRAAPPLRAARWYTEGVEVGEHEREQESPRRESLPPVLGLVPCATSFAIVNNSVRFIGPLLLTFRESYGMILSEAGHAPHDPPWFLLFLRCPWLLSSFEDVLRIAPRAV